MRKSDRTARFLAILSASIFAPALGYAGEYSVNSGQTFQVVVAVPTASGNIVYANASLAAVSADSDAGSPGTFTSTGSTTPGANIGELRAGAAFSISTGSGVASANGSSGLAFASGYARGGAGFLSTGVGTVTGSNSGNASSNVTGSDPVLADAHYDANGNLEYSVNGVPAVTLATSQSYDAALSVPASAAPTINGFALVGGTPAGVYRLEPATSPFVGASDSQTPAIYADITDSGSFTLDLVSGSTPVTASSAFDGRAALAVVANSTGGGAQAGIELASSALSLTTTANNSSALMSLVSGVQDSVNAISISSDGAVLETTGTSSHAILAAIVSQQGAASLPITLSGDDIEVSTTGADSWGVVGIVSSTLGAASGDVTLSGARTGVSTSGVNSGGVMVSADGGQSATAGLTLSGASTFITTTNDDSIGASLVATGSGQGDTSVTLSGRNALISTLGDRSTGVLTESNGATASAGLRLSGEGSAITTGGADANAVQAIANGLEQAGIDIGLNGKSSRIATVGANSSAVLAAAFADRATVALSLAGSGSAIETSGDHAAGFLGNAIGTSQAIAEARLSGPSALIRTEGDQSVGIALTALATDPDSEARALLALSGDGSAVETSGSESSAVVLSGSDARLVVGQGAHIATTGATSHAALFVSGTGAVEIASGGSVSTLQNDAVGLLFLEAASINTVTNHGDIATGGTAIQSAGDLTLLNTGNAGSAAGAGVDLASGQIWNSGVISGELAAIVRDAGGAGAATIENHGRILANDGPFNTAINLAGNFDDQLRVAWNGIIVGTIEMGAGTDRFVALPGTNLDFLFETAPPEEVVAITGVQLPRPDPNNIVIVDPGYLAGAAAQSGLVAARLASGGPAGGHSQVAQGDCGESVISARAAGSYDDFDADGDRAPARTSSYGVLTEYAPDSCSDGMLSFFLGIDQMEIKGGGSRSRTASVFAGGRYAGVTGDGIEYEVLGGVSYLSGDSSRYVLNNRVASGVEIASADYSGWTSFAGLKLSRSMMMEELEVSPFLQAHVAYGGGFDAGETGVATPVLFDVGGSYGYDVSVGVSAAMQPEIFDAAAMQLSFSGALAMAGSDARADLSLSDSTNATYSRDSFDVGVTLGTGLDLTFESAPAKLRFEVLATTWSHGNFSMSINSNFKYTF